jgi:hypothetical protein
MTYVKGVWLSGSGLILALGIFPISWVFTVFETYMEASTAVWLLVLIIFVLTQIIIGLLLAKHYLGFGLSRANKIGNSDLEYIQSVMTENTNDVTFMKAIFIIIPVIAIGLIGVLVFTDDIGRFISFMPTKFLASYVIWWLFTTEVMRDVTLEADLTRTNGLQRMKELNSFTTTSHS